ncbi:hypothetical protein ACFWXA_34420 [Streptomyces atroolivaceus]|uniref:hypothetical protein n=1 Tax=Streptomyces atroolivaceus TaxID=66869 RepID=UPI0036443AF2
MAGLGIVWLVHAETGSFGAAGPVTGSFAVAETLVGPQTARLKDGGPGLDRPRRSTDGPSWRL